MTESKIKLYDPFAFTVKYLPNAELQALFKGHVSRFLLVPVEVKFI